jgi:hypothetical protein
MLCHWHGEHKRVGVDGFPRKMEEPTQGNGKDEEVDEQQVERKQPYRLFDVVLVHILDHQHLELAREHDDGDHRDEHQRNPVRISADGFEGEKALEGRLDGSAGEHPAEAAIDAIRDEQADRQECEELHHRLEGDRRHHALMTLAGVNVPRAEQYGEGGHDQRDVERRVLQKRCGTKLGRHLDVRVVLQHGEACRDCLQLQ